MTTSTTDGVAAIRQRIRALQVWVVILGAVVLACTITGLLVPQELRPVSGIVAALGVFAGVFVTWRKSRAEESLRDAIELARSAAESARAVADNLARAAKERSAVVLGYHMSEVLGAVDRLAREEPNRRSSEISAVRQSAVIQAKDGVSAADPRVAYFRLEDPLATDRVLRADKAAYSPDRQDRFRTEFLEANDRDSNVWGILDGRDPTNFVDDIDTNDDPRLNGTRGRAYKTFITARVAAGDIGFGVLTVNAIRAGSLLPEDRYLVEAIARVLGLAEMLCLSTQTYRQHVNATRRDATMSTAVPTMSDELPEGET